MCIIFKNREYKKKIKEIINSYNIGGILMGLPINEYVGSNKMSQSIKDTTKDIDLYIKNNNLDIPIIFWDESFTSIEAETKTKDLFNNTKKQKASLDKYAAQIILDDFKKYLVMNKKIKQPLEGINVLDLTRVLAGPTSTQVLGDLGANIIKIERPVTGDDSRNLGPPYLDKNTKNPMESSYFLSVNRNKKSVAIDLTSQEGQELTKKLVKKCDILVENFRAGNLKQYGLDYSSIIKINPNIIYCSITGFGQNGPYAKRGGYDYLVQAMGGIMSITGEENGNPTKIGVGVSDIITGLYSSIAILVCIAF